MRDAVAFINPSLGFLGIVGVFDTGEPFDYKYLGTHRRSVEAPNSDWSRKGYPGIFSSVRRVFNRDTRQKQIVELQSRKGHPGGCSSVRRMLNRDTRRKQIIGMEVIGMCGKAWVWVSDRSSP
jgi:hypothetical protein